MSSVFSRVGFIKKQHNRYILDGKHPKPIHVSISDSFKEQMTVCIGICKNSYFLLFSYKKQTKTFMIFTQISNTFPNSSICGAFTWHSPSHFLPRSAYSIIHLCFPEGDSKKGIKLKHLHILHLNWKT